MTGGRSIRTYEDEDFSGLYQAFIDAFADYRVMFRPTENEFYRRVKHKLRVRSGLSPLTFEHGSIVGFILHATKPYKGQLTMYNGGTGVAPASRGRHLTESMYEYILPKAHSEGIQRVLLEVLESNHTAIHVYEHLGFEFRRVFKCFRLNTLKPFVQDTRHELRPYIRGNVDPLSFGDFDPCFIDHFHHVEEATEYEAMIGVYHADVLVGYLIWQPHLGRISQIAVHPQYRQRGYGRSLVQHAAQHSERPLTILNVPEDAHDTVMALEKIGFVNELNQFEMEIPFIS